MRVIAGSARRISLQAPKGLTVRPTTDRIKETLFNMLSSDIPGAFFLDLFSGSGSIGIEALSRGAELAVFSEIDRNALQCIHDNIKATHMEGRARVLSIDAICTIRQLEREGKVFDLIFMDPPYNQEWERKILEQLLVSSIVSEDTKIIVEASLETGFDYLNGTRLQVVREKKYKTNKHIFISVVLEDSIPVSIQKEKYT